MLRLSDTNSQQWTRLVTCKAFPIGDIPTAIEDQVRRSLAQAPLTDSEWARKGEPLAACSAHGPRFLSHEELIARATAIRSSGTSCSVRANILKPTWSGGQPALLPTRARNADASGTACVFRWKCPRHARRAAAPRLSRCHPPSGHRSATSVDQHRRERSGPPCRTCPRHRQASDRSPPCSLS